MIICHTLNILVFMFGKFEFLTLNLSLNMNSDLDQVSISNSSVDDMAPSTGDYCSMALGVLQISSSTRNLVPRFKWGIKE